MYNSYQITLLKWHFSSNIKNNAKFPINRKFSQLQMCLSSRKIWIFIKITAMIQLRSWKHLTSEFTILSVAALQVILRVITWIMKWKNAIILSHILWDSFISKFDGINVGNNSYCNRLAYSYNARKYFNEYRNP